MKDLTRMQVVAPSAAVDRMTGLIWGPVGSGKTTLAATAPGKKLWIQFDPEGAISLTDRTDVVLVDLSAEPDGIVLEFKDDDPLRLGKYLKENEDIETVVFDSLTSFGDKAQVQGVASAQMTKKGKEATLEDPGYAGFGNKNTWTRLAVQNLLRITKLYKRSLWFIAHEDRAEKDANGVIKQITIMLGSSLSEQVPLKLNEVWRLADTGTQRRIYVRTHGHHKPMRSKMFDTRASSFFVWYYDALEQKGQGISDWYAEWKANQFRKIPLPELPRK